MFIFKPPPFGPDNILYEDNHLLAVSKLPRLLVAGDSTGDVSLLDLSRDYIKQKYQKPGNVYLGLVHRLDRPTSGVVLFARTSKAAARLSEQFRVRRVQKVYQGLFDEPPPAPQGKLVDWLLKDEATNVVKVVSPNTTGAKQALLAYRTLQTSGNWTLLEIELETGRSHQIRVQFGSRRMAIWGDRKYGSTGRCEGAIALHAASLTVEHPTRNEPITFTAPLPTEWKLLLDRGW